MVFLILIFIIVLIVAGLWLTDLRRRVDHLNTRLTEMERAQRARESERERKGADLPLRSGVEAAERPGSPHLYSPFVAAPEKRVSPPQIPSSVPAELPPTIPVQETRAPLPKPEAAVPIPPLVTEPVGQAVNWERFLGVKMLAWVGGFILFLGIAFFIKYSFERNLIPPSVRIVLGFLTGAGLIGGGLLLRKKAYAVTSQTLIASGVLSLYGVSFAGFSLYHLYPLAITFGLMSAVTVTALLLASKFDAQVVAVLGIAGGFLTPALLSSGQDHMAALYSYIALLDVALIILTLRKGWTAPIFLGAIGTVTIEIGWYFAHFTAEKIVPTVCVMLFFNALFAAAARVAPRFKRNSEIYLGSAGLISFSNFAFCFAMLASGIGSEHYSVWLAFLFLVDLAALSLAPLAGKDNLLEAACALPTFLLLAFWTRSTASQHLIYWQIGADLVFGVIHSLLPALRARSSEASSKRNYSQWLQLGPLILFGISILTQQVGGIGIWTGLLLLNAIGIAVALAGASGTALIIGPLATFALIEFWIGMMSSNQLSLTATIPLMLTFSAGFVAMSVYRLKQRPGSSAESLQTGAVAASLPFLLLFTLIERVDLTNPSPVFGAGLFLGLMLMFLSQRSGFQILAVVGLFGNLLLETFWHGKHFDPAYPWLPLAWYAVFFLGFAFYPFARRKIESVPKLLWAASALSGPLHFLFFYDVVQRAFPNVPLGTVPLIMAVAVAGGFELCRRRLPSGAAERLNALAWWGGSALSLVTLIFPVQFKKEWLTIGWALEGAALVWLYRKVPHTGLRRTGAALLAIAFARLAINPAVFAYHPASGRPLFNWHLYSYGIVILATWAAARLWVRSDERPFEKKMPALLYSMATVLAFILLNVEIADYFSEGGQMLTFQFSGNFARDMSYSIGWALFAFFMLVVGIRKRLHYPRYASIGLLGVTLVKVFFHDLSQLAQIYRIIALIAVAIILIVASFLYQKFLAEPPKRQA